MNDLNVFSNSQRQEMSVASAATAIAATKQAQEVQARMVVAKKFPRDEEAAMSRTPRTRELVFTTRLCFR